jgi:LPXTG-motif cell wall-anchored protein
VLQAGQDITITQTNSELPPLAAPVVSTTTTPTPPATITGGTLPKTSSPWFNILLIGIGAMVLGGLVLGLKRSPKI